jgi:hypothetical protein
VLILPMLFGAFQPPKPENRVCRSTHLMVDANLAYSITGIRGNTAAPLRDISVGAEYFL